MDDEDFDFDEMMERLRTFSTSENPLLRTWQLESAADKPKKRSNGNQIQKKKEIKGKANRSKKKNRKRR